MSTAQEGKSRKAAIEERLRSDLSQWFNQVQDIRNALSDIKASYGSNPSLAGIHSGQLQRLMNEISQASSDLTVITQDLNAAKVDAEYRAVLVGAWPKNSFLDRLAYLGAAILGAGGAAFVLAGWVVTATFWIVGGSMTVYALAGLRSWERKKWEFYADQYSIEPRYRPRF